MGFKSSGSSLSHDLIKTRTCISNHTDCFMWNVIIIHSHVRWRLKFGTPIRMEKSRSLFGCFNVGMYSWHCAPLFEYWRYACWHTWVWYEKSWNYEFMYTWCSVSSWYFFLLCVVYNKCAQKGIYINILNLVRGNPGRTVSLNGLPRTNVFEIPHDKHLIKYS